LRVRKSKKNKKDFWNKEYKESTREKLRVLSFLLSFLCVASLLFLVFFAREGYLDFLIGDYVFSIGQLFTGCILGLIGGIYIHEIGHALEITAFNGRVYGITFCYSFPFSAYTRMNAENVSRWGHIRICFAGVRMNIILSGASLALSFLIKDIQPLLFGIMLINMELALLNLIASREWDGRKCLYWLIGDIDIKDESKQILKEKEMLSERDAAVLVASVIYKVLDIAYFVIFALCICFVFNL